MEENYPKRFLIWTNLIIDNIEGGFVNHKSDPGGATNFGITERVARKHGYTGDMLNFTRSKAIEIYYKDYWDNKIMEWLLNGAGLCVYDTSINSGYKRAIILLQRACGVKDDGILGHQTLNAVSAMSERDLIENYNDERVKFYKSLSTFSIFGRGWLNRLAILEREEFKIERQMYLD